MRVKDIEITEVTDTVLDTMDVGIDYAWDEWWRNIVGKSVPRSGTKQHEDYKKDRLAVKNAINKEMIARKLANRLICRNAYGIYLEGKDKIATLTVDVRTMKAFNGTLTSKAQYIALYEAHETPAGDKKLLNRAIAFMDTLLSLQIGTVSRMRLLPKEDKQKLLDEMDRRLEQ